MLLFFVSIGDSTTTPTRNICIPDDAFILSIFDTSNFPSYEIGTFNWVEWPIAYGALYAILKIAFSVITEEFGR